MTCLKPLHSVSHLLQWPISLTAVAAVLLYRGEKRRLKTLLDLVECGGRLKRPLLVAPGYLYSYHYSAGRHGRREFSFEQSGPAERVEALDWSHASGYLVAAGDDWLLLWLPAYEVLEDCCQGYYIAAVKPSLTAERGPAVLDLSTEDGDYAKAMVRVRAGLAEAVLDFWPTKARSARVELIAHLGPRRMSIKLAESGGGTATGAVVAAGKPGMYVVKDAVYYMEANVLGIEPGHIWGLGRGDYKVKLVIDRAWKPDVTAEVPL